MIRQIKFAQRYFRYLVKAKHYYGHGIHSPFIYSFVREVLFKRFNPKDFLKVETYRKKLLKNKGRINVEDHGAGSVRLKSKQRTISDIAACSSSRKKYGRLLARIVAFYQPKTVIELGTSLGVGASYLLIYLDKNSVFYTIEGDTGVANLAMGHFQQTCGDNVQLINSRFDEALPRVLKKLETVDLVFFDGNHTKEATVRYFEACLAKANNNTIFIFDDIHWSDEMEHAWGYIQKHPKTKVCIDLFQFGVVFFRKELSKQNFTIRF